ncbi:MAG: hypothetical protein K2R93_14480 [Gemmatimonadaceae bacterium]|nr:hypothetical protein [Gemmatimonadaceae bacterium]
MATEVRESKAGTEELTSRIPIFTLENIPANQNVCETQRFDPTARKWTAEREAVEASVSKQIEFAPYSAFALSRSTRRSVAVTNCILRTAASSRAFIRNWRGAQARSNGRRSTFSGDEIWCTADYGNADRIECNGVTCFWGGYATSRSALRSQGASLIGSSWECGNGCQVFAVEGGLGFSCQDNQDFPTNSGGTALPNDFECTPAQVPWGGNITCKLTISGHAVGDDTVYWKFEAADTISGMQSNVVVEDTTNALTWSGPMVKSGRVSVQVRVNGVQYAKNASVTVDRRPGWSWSAALGWQPGAPGDIDGCFDPEGPNRITAGLTASASCAQTVNADILIPISSRYRRGSGYTLDQVVGGGPNRGLWYVSSFAVGADLRTQLHKKFRADGPTYSLSQVDFGFYVNPCAGSQPSRTHESMNACYSTESAEYNRFTSVIWAHEASHANLIVNMGRTTSFDLQRLTERVVANESNVASFFAETAYEVVRDSLFRRSKTLDPNSFTDHATIKYVPLSTGRWTTQRIDFYR